MLSLNVYLNGYFYPIFPSNKTEMDLFIFLWITKLSVTASKIKVLLIANQNNYEMNILVNNAD